MLKQALAVWERGLKSLSCKLCTFTAQSLPVWERGLKLIDSVNDNLRLKSLPVWERGLKLDYDLKSVSDVLVAPRVGAWIEIPSERPSC